MSFLRQTFLILLTLVLGGGKIFAASESRAFASATAAFQAQLWNRAETEFSRFREDFPDSTNVSQAILFQAQAEFKRGKFTNSIALLKSQIAKAGSFADQYVYWVGESEFAESNFLAAADTFTFLARNFADSPLRARGIVEAASAQAKLKHWPEIETLLEKTNGVFQSAAQMDSTSETVTRGRLLLAQAKFEQKKFAGAAAVLESIGTKTLLPSLAWQRADLLCRVKIGAGDLQSALAGTTNLIQIVGEDNQLAAESRAMRADILEKLNLPDKAIAAYHENLGTNAPVERQRQAILKIAEITEEQNQFTNAGQSLVNFLEQFSNAPAADMALLTIGELHLKIYENERSTNALQQARTRFNQFIGEFTNSPLTGKAFLDRGWCDWFDGNISAALSDFESAAQKLPPSLDLAIAKFKVGDALFKQSDFSGARKNYDAVLSFTNFPAVAKMLGDRALYQSLRASLELKDLIGASRSLAKLLTHFPTSDSVRNAELLYGEGLADLQKPADARETFQTFEQQWPDSPLQPQVEFAIARTYELERNWPAVIAKYENWLGEFPTNKLRSRASYALAWANFQGGDETNALALFENFAAQFSSNYILAPRAQWWIADHFYNAGEFIGAETNYARVYQNWPASELAYPARLMAGRSALGRGGYTDAMRYFRDMIGDTNCPPGFNAEARFMLGATLMSFDAGDATKPLANFASATNVFARLIQNYPANPLASLAEIKTGDCDLQMNNFDAATNAYAAVFDSTNVAVSLRSEAQIGFGIALEKKAEPLAGDDKKALQQTALKNYLDVFYETNLRGDESADPFWTKKAGLQALPLIETLGGADPNKFIDQMETLLPQLKSSLEKKRAELSQTKS